MIILKKIKKKIDISLSLLKPQFRRKFYIIFIFILIGIFLEILSLTSILPLATSLTEGNNVIYNFLNKNSDTTSLLNFESVNIVYFATIVFFLLFMIKNLYLFILNKYQAKFLTDITADLRSVVYDKYLNQSVISILSKNSNSFINNLIHNCNVYSNIFIYSIFNLILEILVFVIFVSILFYFNPQSTILAFSIFGLVTLTMVKFNRSRVLRYSKILHDQNLFLIKNIQHTYSGIKDIKILNKENFFQKLIGGNISQINFATYKSGVIAIYPKYLLEVVAIFFLLLFFNLNFEFKDGLLKISPFLFLFSAAIFRLLPSLGKIVQLTNKLRHAAEPVKTLIHDMRLLEDNQELAKKYIKDLKIKKPTIINLKNINFSYPKSKDNCLEDLNWKISGNSLTGICGRSGAGKTTLIDIIMGLKTPTKGYVKVGDHFLEKIKFNWYSLIGYVQQDVFMLDDSIKNNIAFGVPRNEINLKLIDKVIEDVDLKGFIKSLPKGINTSIGERASRISGGQKQRIAIARALYRNPRVLILDEATNGLDLKNEKEIMNLLQKLKKKVMIIFISHKVSILKNCDNVYLLKNKKIYKQ